MSKKDNFQDRKSFRQHHFSSFDEDEFLDEHFDTPDRHHNKKPKRPKNWKNGGEDYR